MTTRAHESDCTELLARYRTLADQLSLRYGAGSQAVVFVHYEELLAVRSMLLSRRGDLFLESRLEFLRERIQELYTASEPDNSLATPWRRVLRNSPPLIEYDRSHFDERYRSVCDRVVADTLRLTGPDSALERLSPRVSYMFVVTDLGELRVWNRPFELQDLVFGRNRATVDGVPVAHPMLVPERLRVSAAGEIVLLGTDRVEMVVANTKSGHFRPPPESAEAVRQVCRETLHLTDADVDVFTLFTTGPATPQVPGSKP